MSEAPRSLNDYLVRYVHPADSKAEALQSTVESKQQAQGIPTKEELAYQQAEENLALAIAKQDPNYRSDPNNILTDRFAEQLNNAALVLLIVVVTLVVLWMLRVAIMRFAKNIYKRICITSSEIIDAIKKVMIDYKFRKHQSEVRKLVEATIITESIKSELKDIKSHDIHALTKQITEAIEARDCQHADVLMTMAERLKILNKNN